MIEITIAFIAGAATGYIFEAIRTHKSEVTILRERVSALEKAPSVAGAEAAAKAAGNVLGNK